MSVTTSNTYIVETAELLRRTYVVTTPGDEGRAGELAAQGDYGAPVGESVELVDDDDVLDFSIVQITPQ